MIIRKDEDDIGTLLGSARGRLSWHSTAGGKNPSCYRGKN
jgi:hypothetical protein